MNETHGKVGIAHCDCKFRNRNETCQKRVRNNRYGCPDFCRKFEAKKKGLADKKELPRPRLGKQARAMLKAMGEEYRGLKSAYETASKVHVFNFTSQGFKAGSNALYCAIRAAVRAALEIREG